MLVNIFCMNQYNQKSKVVVLGLSQVYHELYGAIANNAYSRGIVLDTNITSSLQEIVDFIIGSLVSSLIYNVQTRQTNDINYTSDIRSLAESLTDFFPDVDQAVSVIQNTESTLLGLLIVEVPNIDNLKIISYSISTSIDLFIEHLD
jgi:hypothetical protein